MVMMMPNWKAEFKNAAGENVFVTAGHKNEMSMDMPTGDTFLQMAMVSMEEQELKLINRGAQAPKLREKWDSVVIDADAFGVSSFVVNRVDVTDAQIQWAIDTADNNSFLPPTNELM